MRQIANLSDAEAALEAFHPSNLKRFAYTTDHIGQFMDYIGNPQDIPRSIHIAGTSGKTSTAYYAAALLVQAGKKAGLLVSPHTEAITERVQINLQPLPEKEFCQELSIFLEVVAASGITLTYAEILYAFAYWEFARHQVEYIVVETGLGGLYDATNVIDRPDKICVITDIGLDHTTVLGGTLAEITQHKAGIIHLRNTVFCHAQEPAVLDRIRSACRDKQADLHVIGRYRDTAAAGLPLFQRRNFALALRSVRFALEREGESLADDQIAHAAQVRIPSRMEIVKAAGKVIVMDGAHNPQKARALRESIEDYFPGQPVAVLAALVDSRGRKLEDVVAEITPLASYIIATSLPPGSGAHAGRDPVEVLEACRKAGHTKGEVVADPAKAYRALLERPEPILLVTGSFYLLEQLRPVVLRGAGQEMVRHVGVV